MGRCCRKYYDAAARQEHVAEHSHRPEYVLLLASTPPDLLLFYRVPALPVSVACVDQSNSLQKRNGSCESGGLKCRCCCGWAEQVATMEGQSVRFRVEHATFHHIISDVTTQLLGYHRTG